MARQLQDANLTVEEANAGIKRLTKRLEMLEQFEPSKIASKDPSSAVAGLRASIDDALVKTFGSNTKEYMRYCGASSFSWPINALQPTPTYRIAESLEACKANSIALLNSARLSLEEIVEEADVTAALPMPIDLSAPRPLNRKVFIVHGHDDGPKEAVARFLAKIGFEPVILHEQANKGQTIIEKFMHHADVGFAVVCMTPDDIGGVKSTTKLEPRARQNVIMELGFFIGKLGRANVCALKSADLEIPSDILGVLWTNYDNAGAWKSALAKELEAADFEIDWNQVMR